LVVEGASGGNVEEEDVGRIAYADHACFVRGDGAVVYGDGEFYCAVTFPLIDVPDFYRVVVVPTLSTLAARKCFGGRYPMRARRVPSRAEYRHMLLLI